MMVYFMGKNKKNISLSATEIVQGGLKFNISLTIEPFGIIIVRLLLFSFFYVQAS